LGFHVEKSGTDAKLIQDGPLGVAYHFRHQIYIVPVARITAHTTVPGPNIIIVFQDEDCDNNGLDPNSMSKYKTSILNRYLADSIESLAGQDDRVVSRNIEAHKSIHQNGEKINIENAESLKNKNQFQSRKRPSGSTTEKLYRESNSQSSKKLRLSADQPRPILPMQPNFLLFPPFSSNVDGMIRPG
jgi:hypothetical protein